MFVEAAIVVDPCKRTGHSNRSFNYRDNKNFVLLFAEENNILKVAVEIGEKSENYVEIILYDQIQLFPLKF
jgi:hypothetical protein